MNLYEYMNFSSESELREVERDYGRKIPWDFKTFLMKYAIDKDNPQIQVKMPRQTINNRWRAGEAWEFNLLNLDRTLKYTYIPYATELLQHEWGVPGKFIPFAMDDNGGNWLILKDDKVYFVDHEESDRPLLIDDSFSEFMKRVKK